MKKMHHPVSGYSLHLMRVWCVLVIVLNTCHGLSYFTCIIALGAGTLLITALQMRELRLREFR